MKFRTRYQRVTISFALSMVVATVFTFSSFAAPAVTNPVADPVLVQDCTGTLTVKSGHVNINGNAAQTGATVMTGSIISTGSNGKAIIDLGAMGRVELGDNTTVTLTCGGSLLEIRSQCSKTEVEVRAGSVNVISPKTETLVAGKKETYGDSVDMTATAGVDVKVECEGRKAGAALWVGPGLWGLLALIGVGAAVAIGIAEGGGDNAPPSSPVR